MAVRTILVLVNGEVEQIQSGDTIAIPNGSTATTQTTNDNSTKVASTAYADAPINVMVANWLSILSGQAAFIATNVTASDVYFLSFQSNTAIRQATATALAPAGLYLKSSDYPTVNGKTAKLRIKISIAAVNDVAPGQTLTVGLYPVSAPTSGTTGGAGLRTYNAGTVVTGSNGSGMVFTTPAADSMTFDKYSATFSFPSDGFYCLGASIGGAMTASSLVHMIGDLQVHYE